jgi:hypothetical protein
MQTNSTLPPADREAANKACIANTRGSKQACETGTAVGFRKRIATRVSYDELEQTPGVTGF